MRTSIRLTPEAFIGIETMAGRLGMKTSPYIRALIDAHLERNPEWPVADRRALAASTTLLRKIGVNLNQLTRTCKAVLTLGKRFPSTEADLKMVLKRVEDLQKKFAAEMRSRDSYWQMKGNRDA